METVIGSEKVWAYTAMAASIVASIVADWSLVIELSKVGMIVSPAAPPA